MKTEWIEIPDPKDWQVGDTFEGRYEVTDGESEIVTEAKGLLKNNPSLSKAVYVTMSLPYVTDPKWRDHRKPWEWKWTNVRVTREVEVPPTLAETLEALPPGSVVFINNVKPGYEKKRATWVRMKTAWRSSTDVRKTSADLADLIENHGGATWTQDFRYEIVNREDVVVTKP